VTEVATSERRTRPSADATREAILAAALDLFSERGFDGAATREIAARAGVTQPLLNYHFRTKTELWRSALEGIFEALAEALAKREEGLRGVGEPTASRLLVHEFVAFSARNPELHRIITQECKADGPRMDWLVEQHIRPIYDAVIARFTALVDAGHVLPIAPEHLYYILTGAGPTMFVLGPEARRLTGLDPTSDDVIEAHADAVCLLLFRD
jgi:AcrR family transcriptional regulator